MARMAKVSEYIVYLIIFSLSFSLAFNLGGKTDVKSVLLYSGLSAISAFIISQILIRMIRSGK